MTRVFAFLLGAVLSAGCGETSDAARKPDQPVAYVGTRLIPDEEPQIVGNCTALEGTRVECTFVTSARCRKVWVDKQGTTHAMNPPEFQKCPEQAASGKEIGARAEGSEVDVPLGSTDASGKIDFDLAKQLPAPSDVSSEPASRVWARVLDLDQNVCELPLGEYRDWFLAEQARLRMAKENHEIAELMSRADSFDCLRYLRGHAHITARLDKYLQGKELARCAADELVKQAQASLRSGALVETEDYIRELKKLMPDHPKLGQIEDAQKRFQADRKLEKALNCFHTNDFQLARNTVIECLALVANHKECTNLARRINARQVKTAWKRGLRLIKAGKYREAMSVATNCLTISQQQPKCRKLEVLAGILLENPQPEDQGAVESLRSELWVESFRKAGTGIVQTEPFEITARKWRVDHSNNGGGILQITVHRDKKLIATVVKTSRAGTGEKILDSKGVHFMKINSANTRWVVSVKQYLKLESAVELKMAQKKSGHRMFMTVVEWSGKGSKATDQFKVDAERWKIEYSSAGSGFLQIQVYRGKRLAATAANMTVAGRGESWVYEPGNFHLKINSNTDWTVKIMAP